MRRPILSEKDVERAARISRTRVAVEGRPQLLKPRLRRRAVPLPLTLPTSPSRSSRTWPFISPVNSWCSAAPLQEPARHNRSCTVLPSRVLVPVPFLSDWTGHLSSPLCYLRFSRMCIALQLEKFHHAPHNHFPAPPHYSRRAEVGILLKKGAPLLNFTPSLIYGTGIQFLANLLTIKEKTFSDLR